ncbi:type VII secretion protein EccB [Mycobacterium sp.]|uniref:type VII secretion protein EccB n=1 Tax=Mycobacterium sp. TaxID=1785 RepID=UPI003BA9237F
MTNQEPDHDWDDDNGRRSFSSRTPVNEHPDKVVYRRGFVTRHQVSGWRFVMRRIASGIALHDTRMLVDPLRTQSRAVLMGVLVLVTGLAGCFVFSLIRPNKSAGSNPVLADRSTAAMYVRVGEDLHPVLNLTSARLIAGRPVNPAMVKSSELDQFPRGNLIGIPGAPERMVQNASGDADWTVCDAVGSAQTEGSPGVTVIAGPPDSRGARAAALGPTQAVLVDVPAGEAAGTWLLWNGRRSKIDLADHAVTNALGLGAELPTPRPIALGLFNAIPEAPPLAAPRIPNAGNQPDFSLSAPVGAVVEDYSIDKTGSDVVTYYAVLPDGLQPISPVLAAILRNTDSYGLQRPPRLDADEIAKLPVSQTLDTTGYPDQPVGLVGLTRDPVTCAYWSKPVGAATSTLSLLSGSALPVPDGVRTVELVGAGSQRMASRVALAPGTGYFVRSAGGGSAAPASGSLFWISDTGVRYGIDTAGDTGSGTAGNGKTVQSLGLKAPPIAMPWSMLSLLAPGPTLSRADALLAHDGLPPDRRPGRVVSDREEPQ